MAGADGGGTDQDNEIPAEATLPAEARRRLQQERSGRGIVATGLGVDELLLVRAEGCEPLGLVMGSSVFHLGWQFPTVVGEMRTLTEAHLRARTLAMQRMEAEAAALGAHGVVGVRLSTEEYAEGLDTIEFKALGTAVRLRGPAPARPFLSDLSGEDFWLLLRSGWLPKGLAMGYSAYYVTPDRWQGRNWGRVSMFSGVELRYLGEAITRTKQLALSRLEQDARELGAAGVTGVRVETRRHLQPGNGWPSMRVDALVLGTAISPPTHARPVADVGTRPILSMTGVRPMRSRGDEAQLG